MVRINAVLSEDLICELDIIARDEKKSRSMLLREAAEKLIDEHRKEKAAMQRRARIRKAIQKQDDLRKKSGSWDGVAEIRKWRARRP